MKLKKHHLRVISDLGDSCQDLVISINFFKEGFFLDLSRDELETIRVSLCNREDILEFRIVRCSTEKFYLDELEKTSVLLLNF